MSKESIDISVIVPTHNRSDALDLTMQSLKNQAFAGTWEVIVVNNNCTDDTNQVVENQQQEFPVSLTLIQQSVPGASATRNAGAKAARGEYIIFIDNDILCPSDLLEKHLRYLTENPNCWIVGQVVNMPEQERSVFGKFRKELFPLVPQKEPPRETAGLTGQNVSMRKRDFELLGGFDESFHVASGEDQELSMRARKHLGIKVLLVPDILVTHNDWAGWTFKDFCDRQSKYAQTEFMFWKKYGEDHPRLDLVRENLPLNLKKDSLSLSFRKIAKKGLSAKIVQSALISAGLLAEKIFPFKPFLRHLYKLTLAGAIHQGFRKGMQSYAQK